MIRQLKGIAFIIGVTVLVSLPIGCSGHHKNMSPGLSSISRSMPQRWNEYHRSMDTNLRQIHDDLNSSAFLMDRPSRLSKYPIP